MKQVPTTRPAEEPGTPLEPSRKRRPREMVTQDRIRLTGLLRKKPWQRGFFYSTVKRCITPVHRAGAYGLGLRVEAAGFVGVNRIVEPKAAAPASTEESVRLCFGSPGRWTSAAKSSCVIPSTFRSHRFGGGSPGPCPRKGGGNDAEALL